MAVEPWEYGAEKEVEEKKKSSSGIIYLGILIASAIIAYFYYSKDIRVTFVAIGTFIGAFLAIFSVRDETQKIAVTVLIPTGVFIFLIFVPVSSYADIGYGNMTGIRLNINKILDIFSYEKYLEQFSYDPSNIVSAAPKNYIDARFQQAYIRENQPIEFNVDINVMNNAFDRLPIKARCFIGNNELTANPDLIVFSKSNIEQSSTLTCQGQYALGDELIVKLSADSESKTFLPVQIGKSENIGKVISTMHSDSPYKLSISLGYSQPLIEAKSYIMPITLERQRYNLQELKSLKVSTAKQEGMTIQCDDMPNLEIHNLDRNALKKYLVNAEKDLYAFKCKLIVEEIPDVSQTVYITAEAIYTTESEYKTKVTILKEAV